MARARPVGPRTKRDVERILEEIGPLPARREHSALIVMVGLPASGKTYIAERLRDATSAVLLESDAIRRLLFRRRRYSPAEHRRLFAAVHAAIDRLLARDVSVILDATNLAETERRPLYRLAERQAAKLLVVHVLAPRGVARRRMARRQASGTSRSEAGPEVYERMLGRMEPIERPHYVVDTAGNIERMLRVISRDALDL